MKITTLAYFFESYNFPALRHVYPTNEQLWQAFNKQEGQSIKKALLIEIDWVLEQDKKELESITKYLNQTGIMGPLRFQKPELLNAFLQAMKAHIAP